MTLLKYSGVILLILGIFVIAISTIIYPPKTHIITLWTVSSALSFSHILPLIGLAIALSLVSFTFIIIATIFFIVGYIFAITNYDSFWIYFTILSNSSQHLYLTLPISSFFSGILLISPNNFRKYIILPITFIIGAMLAITTKLTDPTLHDPIIVQIGFIIAIWIILVFILTIHFFYKSWFNIPIRIFASWLLASSLLYGGTAIAVKYGKTIEKEEPTKPLKLDSTPTDKLIIPDFS